MSNSTDRYLFRGMRVDTKEWVYGFYKSFYNHHAERCHIIDNPDKTQTDLVIPETIGQFTGLTDKYGWKIFEQDKIKRSNGDIGTVKWSNQYGCWDVFFKSSVDYNRPLSQVISDSEIIGSVHDINQGETNK